MTRIVDFKTKKQREEEDKEKQTSLANEYIDSLAKRLRKYYDDNKGVIILAYDFDTAEVNGEKDGLELLLDGMFPTNTIKALALTYVVKDYFDSVVKNGRSS